MEVAAEIATEGKGRLQQCEVENRTATYRHREYSKWGRSRRLVASGINDREEIVGTGTIHGETHGYLLKLDCKNTKNRDCEECNGH
jgi:hypothetical protein